MSKSVFEASFDKLVALNIIQQDGTLRRNGKSKADGTQDLVFERLENLDNFNGPNTQALSIAQNSEPSQDIKMTLFYSPERKTVEVYAYQRTIPRIYNEVYPRPGYVAPKLKARLNGFLGSWLGGLVKKGHGHVWE
ncbi:hypothetical protein [Alteromonas sp. 14N.309.X.WAT.G.H12]|uniref:hypothetical protein n=1 Tax=Alteromonas sp. 14N.309.X.WAT.G.H12 TaxID=3120824 RepID=UPI002FD1B4C6